MRKSALAITAALAVSLAPTAAAPAASQGKAVKKIYRDCSDGKINKKHKVKNLKKAKRNLPADIKQYTDCGTAIKKEIRKRSKR